MPRRFFQPWPRLATKNICWVAMNPRSPSSSPSKALPRGVAVVGINSNDPASHADDSPERMKEENAATGYLFDVTQEVARAYRAACTPDFFLFGRGRRLAYRGQMDASRPSNEPAY
jgi:hypothetical protein